LVRTLDNTTPEERAQRADKARQQYYFDTIFFAQKMEELREFTLGLDGASSKHNS